MLPNHIITHHTTDVKLRQVQTDHCIYAYVVKGATEHGFCVCLTCKKGVATEGHTRQGSRWATNHMKQKACKAAHKEALKEFKSKLTGGHIDTPQIVPVIPVPEKEVFNEDPVEILWNKCKENKKYTAFMKEIEENCNINFSEDSEDDDVREFNPVEGITTCIAHAIQYKKDLHEVNVALNLIETENNTLKYDICTLNTTISTMKHNMCTMQQRMWDMEKENKNQAALIAQLQERIQQLEANQQ